MDYPTGMKHIFCYCFFAAMAVISLSSCEHDEPGNLIKPVEERTVLVLTTEGDIYNQKGELVTHLPYCIFASEIIADGDDYFVAGVQSKGREGYWKNGKWNTLHVDFVDDVDHWVSGIGKWDYHIYLLDMPNVLKNSGIFRLEDADIFMPADHGLRVSEGKCYVIGSGLTGDETRYDPVLYTSHKDKFKKEFLPLPEGARSGECKAIYVSNRDHTVIGGIIDRLPAVWIDKQCLTYPVSCPELLDEGNYDVGRIVAITECASHIHAAGFEYGADGFLVATVWTDGIPVHYVADEDNSDDSQAIDIYSYGDDVYLLTREYHADLGQYQIHLWMNGKVITSYPEIEAAGFTVL